MKECNMKNKEHVKGLNKLKPWVSELVRQNIDL